MINSLSFDFFSGNSVLHGMIPCSNSFAIRLLQNCVCPLSSVSKVMINGKKGVFV